jgi:hypothetical protein
MVSRNEWQAVYKFFPFPFVRLGPSQKLKLEEKRFGPNQNTKFVLRHPSNTHHPP